MKKERQELLWELILIYFTPEERQKIDKAIGKAVKKILFYVVLFIALIVFIKNKYLI